MELEKASRKEFKAYEIKVHFIQDKIRQQILLKDYWLLPCYVSPSDSARQRLM